MPPLNVNNRPSKMPVPEPSLSARQNLTGPAHTTNAPQPDPTPKQPSPGSASPLARHEVPSQSHPVPPRGPQTFEEMGFVPVDPKKWYKPKTWGNKPGAMVMKNPDPKKTEPAAVLQSTPASSTGPAKRSETALPRIEITPAQPRVTDFQIPRPPVSPIERPPGPGPEHPRNIDNHRLPEALREFRNQYNHGIDNPEPGT